MKISLNGIDVVAKNALKETIEINNRTSGKESPKEIGDVISFN